MVQLIGANHMIDCTKGDFTKAEVRYGVVLDTVGIHSLFEVRHVLASKGALLHCQGLNLEITQGD